MFLAFCLHYQVAFFYKHKLSLLAHSPFSLWILLWSDGLFFYSTLISILPSFFAMLILPWIWQKPLKAGLYPYDSFSLVFNSFINFCHCMMSQTHLASFLLLSWKTLFVQGALVLFVQNMDFPTGITRMLCMKVLVSSLPCNSCFLAFEFLLVWWVRNGFLV